MEKTFRKEKIGSKYIIKEKIGSGGQANVFLVEDKDTKIEYVSKVLKSENAITIKKEIFFLNKLKNNPYIINIVESGNEYIIRNNKPTRKKDYFILEKAKYGALIDYILFKKRGFGELKSKIIFSKILEGIKFCHKNNICHRDIKLENILIDENFTPRICDFGFACFNNNGLKDYIGTTFYKPPEINEETPYNGIYADIFSLGETLIYLVTGKSGFNKATKKNKNYKYIYSKNYAAFWENFKLEEMILSPEFKDLYIQMIQYVPKDRIKLEEISIHPWFKELEDIKKNNKKKFNEIEDEIKQIFINSVDDISKINRKELQAEHSDIKMIKNYNSDNFRAIDDDTTDDFFTQDFQAKYEDTPMNMKNYIKIKGNLKPVIFMNNLCKNIIRKYGINNCYIEVLDKVKKKLKFMVTFEEEDDKEKAHKNENEEKDDENEINNLIMKIKLYQCPDGYLLNFSQIEGNRKYFLDKFIDISQLVEKIIDNYKNDN